MNFAAVFPNRSSDRAIERFWGNSTPRPHFSAPMSSAFSVRTRIKAGQRGLLGYLASELPWGDANDEY